MKKRLYSKVKSYFFSTTLSLDWGEKDTTSKAQLSSVEVT